MATRTDVMVTLCSAFGVFSAFGAAILAFFTAGGGLQRISAWLVRRGQAKAGRTSLRRGQAVVWIIAAVVALTVIVNGTGLFTSFFWLVAAGNRDLHQPSWAYDSAEGMFYIEAVVISLITVVAVIGSALAALPNAAARGTASFGPAVRREAPQSGRK
jgi:NhaP-type Na+/H+ and K+/H+ antiporter